MKILIIVSCLTNGGAERVASMWVRGFIERGYQVDLVLSNSKAPVTYMVPKETTFHSIDCRKGNNRYINYILTHLFRRRKFEKILHEVNPDIVVSVSGAWCDMIDLSRGNLNFKTIITDHYTFDRPSYRPLTDKQYKLRFIQYNKYDAVTVLTQADKDFIGGRLSNVYVLPNPLSLDPQESVPNKEKIILAAGRLDSWHTKGFDLLILAWAQLANKYPSWTLQIAGAGSDDARAKLFKMIRDNRVEGSVKLLGFQNDMKSMYRRADVFCLSSRYEGFGMVLIEAMSQGCACVACDYKGRQKEIIPDENYGVLCDVNDSDALASALDRVLYDEKLRKNLQKNAIQRSKKYDLDIIMNRWDEILSDCNRKSL